MTDKPRAPGEPFMNRMMSNDYEKRGMATAHLRQAMADRGGQAQSTKTPPTASAPAQSESPKTDG